ncbi:hypothetical protein V8D89_011630 [Ganoderma adspersum]
MFLQKAQKAGRFAPDYERTYWDGCLHGFAALSNPKIKAGWNWSSGGVYPVRVDETDVYLEARPEDSTTAAV